MVLSIQGDLQIEAVGRGKGHRGARGRGGDREEESQRVLATERGLMVKGRTMCERTVSVEDEGPVKPPPACYLALPGQSLDCSGDLDPTSLYSCVTSSEAHQGTMQG